MRSLSIMMVALLIGSFSYATVNPCPLKIKAVEYSDGGSEWRDQALDALNTCAAQGDSDAINLATLMKNSCEKMTFKTDRKLGHCYLSAAKVIGFSLNF